MKKLLWTAFVFVLIALAAPSAQAVSVPTAIAGVNLNDQKPVSLAIDPAKTYAIVFLSAICPCSNSHLTELKNIAADYPDVTVIGIHSNTDESREHTDKYFANRALPFPVIQDDNNKLADLLGAFKTPHAYVINKGQIVYRGGVTDHQTFAPDARKYLRDALEDLKQNRPVKTATTRTLGCAIPRS